MFSSSKPSKSKFAIQLRAAIEKLDGQQKYRYDAEKFRLCCVNGNEIDLSNIYKEHCALRRVDRKANLQRVASIIASPPELPKTFAEAKPLLRPKIWSRATFDFMELKSQIDGSKVLDLPLYPLGSHLYSSLVYETENAEIVVSTVDLNKWGITFSEAMEFACDRLDETTTEFAKIGDGVRCADLDDDYNSSRILLIGRRDVDAVGDPIATVPNRDSMFLAGSEEKNALKALFDSTARVTEVHYRGLSPLPLRLVDGVWEDWTPPKNHVLREQYDDLELRFLGGLYSDQKELLVVLLKEAIFVASFSAVQKADSEELLSYCVWSRYVDSLLPRTQIIAFVTEGGVVAGGEWDHVADIVQDLMVADESYYPVRYRVRNFPTQEQLAAIGNIF